MKAENVNPGNFKVESIIYNDDYFAIAYGVWTKDDTKVLAMRWTGEQSDPNDAGYPKTFGNPMWFIVTDNLKNLLLSALLSSKYSNTKEILSIMLK
jgi:hypothetical protein